VIAVRPARAEDAELLLDWANEPLTRAMSFYPEPIDRATHEAWLAERLADPATRLLIGLEGQVPVGQVRLTRDPDGTVEVGIGVAADVRGRGVGRELLDAALDAGRRDTSLAARRFVARIRPDNTASIALFTGAGFRPAGDDLCNGVPCLWFELQVDPPG
jgi:RimJ/RimL family protein N-acetyltransferase